LAALSDDGAQFTAIVHNGGGDVTSLAATPAVIDGPPADDAIDLALKKNISSFSGSEDNQPFADPKQAVDGDTTTRWSSNYADDAFITIDLGAPMQINGVDLLWENAYGEQYQNQTSLDGKDFSHVVYNQQNGRGNEEQLDFNVTTAQYVRLQGIKRHTQYG
jgi:hypothetical protein